MNNLWQKIITNTYTVKTLKNRVRFLRSYLNRAKFDQNPNKEQNLSPEELIWIESLAEEHLLDVDTKSVSPMMDELDEMVEKTEALTVYFPFDPPSEEIDTLGSWMRSNFGKSELIMDIKYDPALIGGCALVWKGLYRDFSVRKKIQDEKQQILDSFRKYAPNS